MLFVSIPRALAQALGIAKGETLEWKIEDGELVLKRVGPNERKPARRRK
jgi:antitoxin component of MazEF toxin-antitoxin module